MNEREQLLSSCLVSLQSFETWWAYFLQSDGKLFDEECRQAVKHWMRWHEESLRVDSKLNQMKCAVPSEFRRDLNTASILQKLSNWSKTDQRFPFPSARKSRFIVGCCVSTIKSYLIEQLGLPKLPEKTLHLEETLFSEGVLKWKGHLPKAAARAVPDRLIETARNSNSIVVVGDIRKSQDLMTYCDAEDDFAQHMVRFITTTRGLIDQHHGFFDKFTGDGFLAYFNETICNLCGSNYIDCFLAFVKNQANFSKELFSNWSRNLRKRPVEQIGLAIGADLGKVSFNEIDYHFVAVGEAIVWASRMSSIAAANEVVINNRLRTLLETEHAEAITLTSKEGKTKAGEEFSASIMKACSVAN